MAGAGAKPFVDAKINQRKVLLFTKKRSPDCKEAKQILEEQLKLKFPIYEVVEIEKRQDCTQIENYFQIICQTDTRAVPQLFINGNYVGGEKEIPRFYESGKLKQLLQEAGAV